MESAKGREAAAEAAAREAAEPVAAGGPAPDGSADDGVEASAEEAAVEHDLDALVEDLRRERDEYLSLAQRARADFENYRRRSARDADEAERRGKADLARGVLPAVDNLERALIAAGVETGDGRADEDGEPASREVSAAEAFAEGVALIHRELAGALAAAGIETVDPLGEPFDPALHEALSTRPAAGGEQSNVVVETLQRGYRIDGTLIRPARVVVTT